MIGFVTFTSALILIFSVWLHLCLPTVQTYIPRSKLYMQYVISTSCSRVSPGLSFPEKNVLCRSVLLTSLSVTTEQRHFKLQHLPHSSRLTPWTDLLFYDRLWGRPIRLLYPLRREFLISCSSLTDFHCTFILKYSSLQTQRGVKANKCISQNEPLL